jgi:hypothetical protein
MYSYIYYARYNDSRDKGLGDFKLNMTDSTLTARVEIANQTRILSP